ncbi:MAG TPA: hypothetical protein VD863_26050 [Bradyrhizobium sp.]|nr:hypothetical protein [Bradyrhizobium sp.]
MTGGFAAGAFDAATTGATDSLWLIGFNGFDGALCDALAGALPGFLLAPLTDFLAVALVVFACPAFAEVLAVFLDAFLGAVLDVMVVLARAGFPAGVLGDFLRVFLDIRLPFVAFGGSIMEVLRALSRDAGTGPAAGQI